MGVVQGGFRNPNGQGESQTNSVRLFLSAPQVLTTNDLHPVLTLEHASEARGELAENPDGGSPHPQPEFLIP